MRRTVEARGAPLPAPDTISSFVANLAQATIGSTFNQYATDDPRLDRKGVLLPRCCIGATLGPHHLCNAPEGLR